MDTSTFNPYVGLRPFKEDENLLFFGRDQQTLELLQRLHHHRFVAVVGGSGSGKSSLIRAGLIPALKGGYLVEDSSKWLISTMKPGSNPMFNLARVLLSEVKPNASSDEIHEMVRSLKRERTSAIFNLMRPLHKEKNANFFLLIDQFEELFRFSMKQKDVERKAQAIDFVNLILNLSKQKTLPFYVVLTMRSDFIGDCTQFRNLPEAMNESQFLVPRITRQDLKKIIEGPARLYGKQVDPRLTIKIINDLGKVKDELPLLQHAMMRIWDYETSVNKSGSLDLEDYRQVGGIENALSQHADEALSRMSKEEISIAEELFQALTAIDENGRKIRRPLLLSDLKELTGEDENRLLAIIDNFIRDRRSFLIVQDTGKSNDKLIDISHESLIRQWHILGLWVDAENRSATSYLRLVEASELFHLDKKDYLSGTELARAVAWRDEFNPTAVWAERYREGFVSAMTYLRQSERERDDLLIVEKKRKRRLRILAGVIMGLILLFGIYAISSNISIRKQKAALELTNNSLNEANEEIKSRAYSDSVNKVVAIQQKEIAEEALRSVDSALTVAVEQKKIADGAKILADLEAANAKVQEALARAQKDTAQKQFERAEALRISADQKKEAYEMYFEAKLLASKDPTMALRLYEAAIDKYAHEDFKSAALTLINNETFYKTLVKRSDKGTATDIADVDVSPVDKSTLMGNNRGVIRKWDANGNLQFEIQAYTGQMSKIRDLEFSPDGSSFISLSEELIARHWNSDGSILRDSIDAPFGGFNKLTFSPKGSFIVASGPAKTYILDNSSIVINELDHPAPDAWPQSITISPNERFVFLGNSNSNYGTLWDLSTDRTQKFEGHKMEIISAAFSADGQYLLTGSKDASSRLWDLKGDTKKEFKGQWTNIRSVAFAPDGKTVLTGGFDGSVWLWDTTSGEVIKEYVGHTTSVDKIGFAEDGRSIITGSLDGSVREWKLEEVLVAKMEGHGVAVRSVAYSRDGKYMLTGAKKHAFLWDSKGNLIRKTEPHGDYMIFSVDFAPDGKTFITGSDDGIIRKWGLDGKLQLEIEVNPPIVGRHLIRSVAYSRQGDKIVAGDLGWTISIWDAQGRQINRFLEKNRVISVCISPDGKSVLTGSLDGVPKLWDLDGNLIQNFVGHKDNIQAVAFSRDGNFVLSGSSDHTARLWNLDGTLIQEFKGPRGAIVSVAFSNNGKYVATGNGAGSARIWDLNGNIVSEFQGKEKTVFSVAFSPDDKYLLTGAAVNGYLRKIINLEEFLQGPFEPLSEEYKSKYGLE